MVFPISFELSRFFFALILILIYNFIFLERGHMFV